MLCDDEDFDAALKLCILRIARRSNTAKPKNLKEQFWDALSKDIQQIGFFEDGNNLGH